MTIRLCNSSASSGIYLNDGHSDRDAFELFRQYLQPGMTALDCGAHIGEYTLLFAQAVGATGQVHAFEPDPRTFPYLQENVQRNRLTQVVLNHAAVGSQRGRITLHLGADPTASSVCPELAAGPTTAEVEIWSLDEYLRERKLARVDAVKLDVEGAELAALRGAAALLRDYRPGLIFVECDNADNEQPVRALLTDAGYTVTSPQRHGRHPHLIARRPA